MSCAFFLMGSLVITTKSFSGFRLINKSLDSINYLGYLCLPSALTYTSQRMPPRIGVYMCMARMFFLFVVIYLLKTYPPVVNSLNNCQSPME